MYLSLFSDLLQLSDLDIKKLTARENLYFIYKGEGLSLEVDVCRANALLNLLDGGYLGGHFRRSLGTINGGIFHVWLTDYSYDLLVNKEA